MAIGYRPLADKHAGMRPPGLQGFPAPRLPPPLPPDCALFLDIDGALTEAGTAPNGAVLPNRVPRLLANVRSYLGGAVALFCRGSLAQAERLLGTPPFAGAGWNGAELRMAPEEDIMRVGTDQLAVLETLVREHFAGDPRLVVDARDGVVAVHFRECPQRASQCLAVVTGLAAQFEDLEVLRGNLVVEARPRGTDKGRALNRLMANTPFHGRIPIYASEDPDEHAGFEAAGQLGGYGIAIRPGSGRARYSCTSATGLCSWLAGSIRQH